MTCLLCAAHVTQRALDLAEGDRKDAVIDDLRARLVRAEQEAIVPAPRYPDMHGWARPRTSSNEGVGNG